MLVGDTSQGMGQPHLSAPVAFGVGALGLTQICAREEPAPVQPGVESLHMGRRRTVTALGWGDNVPLAIGKKRGRESHCSRIGTPPHQPGRMSG